VKTQGGRRRRTAALWGGRDVAIALDQGRAAIGAQTVASGKRARVCLMVRINYISHDGTRREVDVNEGLSVMEGAVRHHIPGIDGDCGGACACGTCHVYVDPQWLPKLAPPNQLELNMLKMTVEPNPSSRLACQIKVTKELEGLVVTTPVSQY
jgi:2Fe-2S ferredoxin